MARAKSLRWQRVQNVVFREPGAPSLSDSVMQLFHVRGVVGIGVDDDLHAMLFRQPQIDVIEVEPLRIEFNSIATLYLAAAFSTASRSNGYASRRSNCRPVGCPAAKYWDSKSPSAVAPSSWRGPG